MLPIEPIAKRGKYKRRRLAKIARRCEKKRAAPKGPPKESPEAAPEKWSDILPAILAMLAIVVAFFVSPPQIELSPDRPAITQPLFRPLDAREEAPHGETGYQEGFNQFIKAGSFVSGPTVSGPLGRDAVTPDTSIMFPFSNGWAQGR